MATDAKKQTIEIKCHGEFYARDGQLKLTLPFVETVRAPSLKFFEQTTTKMTGTDDDGKIKFRDTTFINVRGVLKKKLLPLILQKKHPGRFVRVRLVTIDEVIAPGETELPINLMSISQLAALMKQRNIPLDPNSYVSVDELRTDIQEYVEDPESFQRDYQRKAKKRAEEKEFMELNDLMPADPLAPTPAAKTTKKGLASIPAPVSRETAPEKGPF